MLTASSLRTWTYLTLFLDLFQLAWFPEVQVLPLVALQPSLPVTAQGAPCVCPATGTISFEQAAPESIVTPNWKSSPGPPTVQWSLCRLTHQGLWVDWTHPGRGPQPLLPGGTWPQPLVSAALALAAQCPSSGQPFLALELPGILKGSSLLLCQGCILKLSGGLAATPSTCLNSAGGPAGPAGALPLPAQHSLCSLQPHWQPRLILSGSFLCCPVFPWAFTLP